MLYKSNQQQQQQQQEQDNFTIVKSKNKKRGKNKKTTNNNNKINNKRLYTEKTPKVAAVYSKESIEKNPNVPDCVFDNQGYGSSYSVVPIVKEGSELYIVASVGPSSVLNKFVIKTLGGELKDNETPTEAAIREALEESNGVIDLKGSQPVFMKKVFGEHVLFLPVTFGESLEVADLQEKLHNSFLYNKKTFHNDESFGLCLLPLETLRYRSWRFSKSTTTNNNNSEVHQESYNNITLGSHLKLWKNYRKIIHNLYKHQEESGLLTELHFSFNEKKDLFQYTLEKSDVEKVKTDIYPIFCDSKGFCEYLLQDLINNKHLKWCLLFKKWYKYPVDIDRDVSRFKRKYSRSLLKESFSEFLEKTFVDDCDDDQKMKLKKHIKIITDMFNEEFSHE